VEFNGKLYTLDNRRLVAFQMADTDIPVARLPWSPPVGAEFVDKFQPVYEGLATFIRGVGLWPPL